MCDGTGVVHSSTKMRRKAVARYRKQRREDGGGKEKGMLGGKSGADKKKMKHRPEKGRVAKQRRGDTKRSE